MLLVFDRISDVDTSSLKTVYLQSIKRMGDGFYRRFPEPERKFLAEERFIDDLRDFFLITHGELFMLYVDGKPVSALRSETYLDGQLISYLETSPDMRGRGYAGILISSVIKHLRGQGIDHIYSHINKKNLPSLAVHRTNGFQISADYAKLLDGTVSQNYFTLRYNSTAE